MATVSILMGVYNCKDIREMEHSVESIIAQTFLDWEFIICNDGSTDTTLDSLNKLALLDSRIKIVSYEENHGLAYALNYAYKFATGKYIARQDADDISYSKRLQREVDYLNQHEDIDLVGTIADVYDKDGIWGTFYLNENPKKCDFLWNSPFLHPSIMMRREAFEKAGMYRVAWETKRAEDYDLFMSMYSCGSKGHNIQDKLYKYKIVNSNKKYRTMQDRVQEAVVRKKGFQKLKIGVKGIPYVIKPIIIGLMPQRLFCKIRKKQY